MSEQKTMTADQDLSGGLPDAAQLKLLERRMREAEYQGLSDGEIAERERQKEERRQANIQVLDDTLDILQKGSYVKNGHEIALRFERERMQEARVYLPDDIEPLHAKAGQEGSCEVGCMCSCRNADALDLAQEKYRELQQAGESVPRLLVLNLASATQPGGHTRQGANAQEEDLCRRTSLLLSLESESAKRYYSYSESLHTRMASDGIVLSPAVEVLKDASAQTLDEPFPIAVMSCAAPMVRLGLEGMTQEQYETMLSKRIQGMFLVAASQGYRRLILGAFGCGVYGNDAAAVSALFRQVIETFTYAGKGSDQLFDSIDFAVLCRQGKDYNYREFCKTFPSE